MNFTLTRGKQKAGCAELNRFPVVPAVPQRGGDFSSAHTRGVTAAPRPRPCTPEPQLRLHPQLPRERNADFGGCEQEASLVLGCCCVVVDHLISTKPVLYMHQLPSPSYFDHEMTNELFRPFLACLFPGLMNGFGRKPAQTVAELASARQHQKNWPAIMERAVAC